MQKRFAWMPVLAALYVPPLVMTWLPPLAGHCHCQEVYLRWMPILPARMALGFHHPEGVIEWVVAAVVPALVVGMLLTTLARKPKLGWTLLAVAAAGNIAQAGVFSALLRM